jgi:hypothetical protein
MQQHLDQPQQPRNTDMVCKECNFKCMSAQALDLHMQTQHVGQDHQDNFKPLEETLDDKSNIVVGGGGAQALSEVHHDHDPYMDERLHQPFYHDQQQQQQGFQQHHPGYDPYPYYNQPHHDHQVLF